MKMMSRSRGRLGRAKENRSPIFVRPSLDATRSSQNRLRSVWEYPEKSLTSGMQNDTQERGLCFSLAHSLQGHSYLYARYAPAYLKKSKVQK